MKTFSSEPESKSEMGSSILYGAINDLDLGEAKIPNFTPPGMPDKEIATQLYGTALTPKAEVSESDVQDSTLLSVESIARGSTKYEE